MGTNGAKSSEFKVLQVAGVLIALLEVLSQAGVFGQKWSPLVLQLLIAGKSSIYGISRSGVKMAKVKADATALSLKAPMPDPEEVAK